MAKLTLSDVVSGYASATAVNTNNALVEAALENTLSRDGTGPNAMGADLDMNSHAILNCTGIELNGVSLIPTGTTSVPASNMVYTPAGTGAVDTTVQTKLRESVSVKDFGAVGDGVTDDLAAFNAAIASFTEQSGLASPWEETNYSNAGTLVVPPGWYYLSGPLELKRNIHLLGASGPDGNSFGASKLLFSNTSNGIIVYNTATSSTGKGADGAIIENLAIMPIAYHTGGSVPAAGTYRGVWLRARARIINCTVAGWPEHGIAIVASVGGGGDLEGNANNWYVEGIRTIQNARTGFYVDGADANAGIGVRIDASQNGERGIYDSSFLGNTYIGAHTAANTLAPYKTDNVNARCVFIGCYVESGQPISEIIAPSMSIGGINDFQSAGAGDAWTFGDKGLRVSNGTVSEPSIGPSLDVDTGLYFPALGSMRLTSNGVNTGIFASGGGAKFSINGTYWGATQNAHEFVQNSTSVHSSIDYLTSAAYTGLGKYINCATAAGTGFNLLTASNAGGAAFVVLGNGNCQNTNNSYGAVSDIKLKENIVSAPSYWDKFKQYQFVNYNFIGDKDKQKQLGLIAQQVEEISPGIVEEQVDYEEVEVLNPDTGNSEIIRKPTGTTTKSIKYSILTLQAEIVLQEAMRRIEELESRLKKRSN